MNSLICERLTQIESILQKAQSLHGQELFDFINQNPHLIFRTREKANELDLPSEQWKNQIKTCDNLLDILELYFIRFQKTDEFKKVFQAHERDQACRFNFEISKFLNKKVKRQLEQFFEEFARQEQVLDDENHQLNLQYLNFTKCEQNLKKISLELYCIKNDTYNLCEDCGIFEANAELCAPCWSLRQCKHCQKKLNSIGGYKEECWQCVNKLTACQNCHQVGQCVMSNFETDKYCALCIQENSFPGYGKCKYCEQFNSLDQNLCWYCFKSNNYYD